MTVPAEILKLVFDACAPLPSFPSPWHFVPVDRDCRGPVADVSATLAALRDGYSEAELEQAGVIQRGPAETWALAPELVEPGSAVIALRSHADQAPFALLTRSGGLPRDRLPILAAFEDCKMAERIANTGTLYATSCVQSVALLSSLGLPVALTTGIANLPLSELKALDARIGADDAGHDEYYSNLYGKLMAEEGIEEDDADFTGAVGPRPQAEVPSTAEPEYDPLRLVLMGWQPLTLTAPALPEIVAIAQHLLTASRYVDRSFAEAYVLHPPKEWLDELQACVKLRDCEVVCRWIQESVPELCRLAPFVADANAVALVQGAPRPNVVTAKATLLVALAAQPSREAADGLEHATNAYTETMHRDLIGPCQAEAMKSTQLNVSLSAMQLADVSALLHEMSPRLLEGLRRQSVSAPTGDLGRELHKRFDEYLKLIGSFTSLARQLHDLMNK